MSHRFKVEERPHTNKDGSPSKTKKDYALIDRTRRGRVEVGVVGSKKALEELKTRTRAEIIMKHMVKNPNDIAFRRKHGMAP